MNRFTRCLNYFLIGLLIMVTLAYCTEAYPDEGHGHDHHDDGGGDIDITGGDVTTGSTSVDVAGDNVSVGGDSNRAYAFSHSLGDVDINQCRESSQWGTIVLSMQKVGLNRWCAAESMDARGMHRRAAELRCGIKEVKLLYRTSGRWLFSKYDMTNCIPDWTYAAIAPPAPPEPASRDDDEDDWREEQVAMQIDYDSRIAQLEQKLSRPPPQTIERTVIEQVPLLTKEQAASLRIQK